MANRGEFYWSERASVRYELCKALVRAGLGQGELDIRVELARQVTPRPGEGEHHARIVQSQMSDELVVRQGEVFWISAESLRPSVQGVPHPHVVIQSDVLNESRIPTTVVCGLSSNLRLANEAGNVLLEAGEANLPHRSVAIVSQVSTVEKTLLGLRIGTLSKQRVEQILAGLSFLQKTYFDR